MRAHRIATLDGLRGWAALAVVFYHTLLATSPAVAPAVLRSALGEQPTTERVVLKLALSLCSGEVAVGLFFVLSGIVLTRALSAMPARPGWDGAPATAWRFALRRLLRIWPALAVCLLAQVALFRVLDAAWPGHLPVSSVADLRDNLLLLRFPVNGATWTLLVEMAAVPLLLVCVCGSHRVGSWIVPALAAASLAAIRWKWMLFGSPELLTGVPFLLAGAAIATGWYDAVCRRGRRVAAGWCALGVLAAGLLLAPSNLLLLRSLALFAALPVLAALVATMQTGPVAAALRSPLSQWLGLVSFSLYLWNVPVFEALLALAGPDGLGPPLAAGLGLGAAATLVTLPVARLSQRWVERPAIELARVLTRQPAGRASARPVIPRATRPR